MLAEALDEARRDADAEIAAADREGADRRKEALLLVSFNLAKLHLHITSSRRILNDLRTLRRLLLAERGLPSHPETESVGEEAAQTGRTSGPKIPPLRGVWLMLSPHFTRQISKLYPWLQCCENAHLVGFFALLPLTVSVRERTIQELLRT